MGFQKQKPKRDIKAVKAMLAVGTPKGKKAKPAGLNAARRQKLRPLAQDPPRAP